MASGFGLFAPMDARSNFVRVRLYFDYPPPAVADCCTCWLLVDLNTCRVVADLESVIKEKFGFSCGSIISLFIEDCYLPHAESVYVVRDNDSVRVKVDCLPQVNGNSSHAVTPNKNCRKRQIPTEEDGPGGNKKKKKGSEEIPEWDDKQSQEKRTKKKKKKNKKKNKKINVEENGPAVTPI